MRRNFEYNVVSLLRTWWKRRAQILTAPAALLLTSTMVDLTRAQELKAEGNMLFAEGEYDAASIKYGDAIRYDDVNAILYANRAACLLHSKR